MKKLTLLLASFLMLTSYLLAQEMTLDPGQFVNAQIAADTLEDGSQAHSVYKVESGEYYAFDGTLDCDFDLVIEGPDNGWIFHDPNPPVFFQTPASDGNPRDMINLNEGGSVTLRNILFTGLHPNDANISSFVRNFAGYKMVFENCVFSDHQDHVTRSTGATEEITITDCVFINGDRRRYSPFGGMPFRLDAACEMLTFENNTSVNSGRLLGNGGDFFTTVFHEIHNTYLNMQVNGHELHWYEGLQANNIYYNWSFRGRKASTNGYEAPFTTFETFSAVSEKLDSLALYEGRNLFFLDSAFFDFWTNQMADSVYQSFLWNDAVDSTILADDNFTIGKNYWQINPHFTNDPSDLEDMIQWMYTNWVESERPAEGAPDWRITPPIEWNDDGTPIKNWPQDWDLTYANADLQTAGTDGLPVGDLNWYPDAKADYLANKDTYIAALRDSMTNSTNNYIPGDSLSAFITHDMLTAVEQIDSGIPQDYYLSSNYPNPFNPTTNIKFSIPKSGMVILKVYNMLGQEVGTLINREMAAGSYKVDFNASKLSSGVYFYTIQAGNFTATKKMMLLK